MRNVEETVTEDGSEDVDASTGGPSDRYTPPVMVKYEFVKYIEYDYWGLVAECYYVDVHNARLLAPGYPFITEDAHTAFMIATLSGHRNTPPTLLGGIRVMVNWTYNIDWSVDVTGGTDFFGSTPTSHTRVG